MKSFLYALLLLATISTPAMATDTPAITVQRLIAMCTPNDNAYDEHFCFGYIQSMNDLYVGELTLSGPDYHFCPPSGMTLGQTRDVFVKWASENPKYANIAGSGGVFIALIKAYPCNPAANATGAMGITGVHSRLR